MHPGNVPRLVPLFLTAAFIQTAPIRAEPKVVVAGSERMVPLVRELAEQYTKHHPEVTIEVEGGGSAEGLKRLEQHTATIAALARPASEDEIRRARLIHKTDLVAIPVAMDAAVFFVRPDNPLESLTLDQIHKIFTHGVASWEQIGGPIEGSISRHMLPAGSGSAGVVRMRAMHDKAYTTVKTEHETTGEVAGGVAGDLLGIGFGGMGQKAGVKILALKSDADSPPVTATAETVQRRAYPLAHYLYLDFPGQPEGPAKDFLAFVISPEGQRIVRESQTGPVPLPMSPSTD